MSQTENHVRIVTLQFYEVSDDGIISVPMRKEKSDRSQDAVRGSKMSQTNPYWPSLHEMAWHAVYRYNKHPHILK